MKQHLQHVKSDVQGKKPTVEDLLVGELAVNYYSGSPSLYLKTNVQDIVDLNTLRDDYFSATTYPVDEDDDIVVKPIEKGSKYEVAFNDIEKTISGTIVALFDDEYVTNQAFSSVANACGLDQTLSCTLSAESTVYLTGVSNLSEAVKVLDSELAKGVEDTESLTTKVDEVSSVTLTEISKLSVAVEDLSEVSANTLSKTSDGLEACWADYTQKTGLNVMYLVPNDTKWTALDYGVTIDILIGLTPSVSQSGASIEFDANGMESSRLDNLNFVAGQPITFKFTYSSQSYIGDFVSQVNMYNKHFGTNYVETTVAGGTVASSNLSIRITATSQPKVNYIHVFEDTNLDANIRQSVINARYNVVQ